MARGNEEISLLNVGMRMAAKLREPGVFKAMRAGLKMKRTESLSMGLLLQDNAQQYPQHAAIKSGNQIWTWAEANAWTNRYANEMSGLGLGEGDVLAINVQNRPECLIGLLAALKLGAVPAMLNTSQTGDVLAHSIGLVQPKLLLVGEEQLQNMNSVQSLLNGELKDKLLYVADGSANPAPSAYVDLELASQSANECDPAIAAELTLDGPCYYIFTSGTTGMPKASIMSRHRAYRSGMMIGKAVLSMTENDVFYCPLPFYHNSGLTLALGACLVSGSAIAVCRKFSASTFWDDCRHYDATVFNYIGELLRYLLNQPEQPDDRMHMVTRIAGNGLRPEIWDEFKLRFGIERIHEFYGASEGNNGFVNLLNFDKTCGMVLGGWEAVVYDVDADEPVLNAQGRMRKVARGEVGLLLFEVSDKFPFDGYTDQSASEKKLLHDVFKKGDCWFNSGDLVRRQGWSHIQFVDRVGDTFRWHGENVATTQVEAVVNQWPQTADAVVCGVQVPGCDGRCGLLAYTVKEGERLDLEGFAEYLCSQLPKYAVPRFLRLHGQAEITGTFKHQKSALKKQGYDPELIKDPLYYLDPAGATWVPVTSEIKQKIDSGEIRL